MPRRLATGKGMSQAKLLSESGLYKFVMRAHPVRIVTIDDNPWFVANDVADALGFTRENLKYHLKTNIAADERGVAKLPTLKGMQPMTTLSESALYKLALRSDKKSAKPLQDWVTRDVLPTIRKDGGYILGEERVSSAEPCPTGRVRSLPNSRPMEWG